MAAPKKTFPFSRLRPCRSRRNGCSSNERKKSPPFKSSLENNSSGKNRFYPLYLTVDDLAAFRRKAVPHKHVIDNLRPLSGKFSYKSEYKKKFRSFKIAADDSIGKWKNEKMKTLENELNRGHDDLRHSEYVESFTEPSPVVHRVLPILPVDHIEMLDGKLSTSTENKDQFVMFKEARRAALARQSTNLRVEGDFEDVTETKEKYTEHVAAKPSELARRNTTLKLEGDVDLTTETREEFKEYENMPRTVPLRRHSSFEIPHERLCSETEYTHAYHFPSHYDRQPLARSWENLRTEGKMIFEPEYTSQYVDYHVRYPDISYIGRRKSFVETLTSPVDEKFSKYCRVKDVLLDRNMKPVYSPEYRHAYVQFPVQRATFKRQRTNLSPPLGIGEKESELNAKYKPFPIQKTSYVRPATHLRPEGKLDLTPEYRKSYVNFTARGRTNDELGVDQSSNVSEKLNEPSRKSVNFAEDTKNGSANLTFRKGKRLPIADSSNDINDVELANCNISSRRPAFRLEVTNPDKVQKPFDKLRPETPFLVLDENNNTNHWTRKKETRKWSPSWMNVR